MNASKTAKTASTPTQKASAGRDGMAVTSPEPLQLQADPAAPNHTGLPDGLKNGVESLSGFSLDEVRVHFNSSKPAQLQALAYTQGTDIHIAPGQERHLPHEAWHVVQQVQRRVKPTVQWKQGVSINDDKGLEHEADVMGAKALQKQIRGASPFQLMEKRSEAKQAAPLQAMADHHSAAVIQRKPLSSARLNVAGENHDRSDEVRIWENEYAKEKTGGTYWQEDEFKVNVPKPGGEADETVSVFGDPKILQMANIIQFGTKSLLDITKFLTRLQNVKATRSNLSLSRRQVFDNCNLIKLHLPKLKAFGNVYKKLKREAQAELPNRPDLKAIGDFYIEFGDAFYNVFLTGIDLWVSNTLAVNKDEANALQLNQAAQAGALLIPTGNELITKMFEKLDVSAEENQEGVERVILERSKAMHEAATKGKASKGVWKIGNTHVKDIKGILEDAEPKYELLTEDEFFAGFNTWLAQSPLHQGFEYGMELADMYDWSESTVFEMAKAGHFDAMVENRKHRGDRPSYIS